MTQHGREISKQDAQNLLEKQLKITKKNRKILSDDCRKRSEEEAAIYYLADSNGEPANCYIFDIEFIQKFIENGATQLLVFLGAQTKNDDIKGRPTVILIGCTLEDNGGKELYRSLPALKEKPAVEHPPVTGIPTLPFSDELAFDIL